VEVYGRIDDALPRLVDLLGPAGHPVLPEVR
jgi:hypothetical protein